jgi:hypothetical protein
MAAAAAALAAGCGNYSTEDIRFLSALPRRQDLGVQVPASSATAGAGGLVASRALTLTAACPAAPGEATVWKWAKPTSDGLNRGVDFVVGLVDTVRKYPPTVRHEDWRRWGPVDAERHPGREIQIVIDRTWPSGEDGPPRYAYRFEARVKGTGAWTPLISGAFVGPSSSRGDGEITLDFEAFWTVGLNDAGTPHGTMTIGYHRSSDPVTTDLDLTAAPAGGFGLASFGYGYAGWSDGDGAFDYAFENAFGDRLEVRTSYGATGAGRLAVAFTPSSGPPGTFRQCWDEEGCLTYVDDPANFTGSCGAAPCQIGTIDPDCPAVKAGTEPF